MRSRVESISARVDEILAILKPEEAQDRPSTKNILSAIATTATSYPAIERAFLFGSFATGTQQTDSDVDVQLQLDRSKRFDLRDLSRFTKDMEQATGRICDMVASDRIEDVAFARHIEADRILAYERSQR